MKKTFFLFMLFVASSILLSQNKKILVTFTDDITNTNSTLRPIGNLAFLDARSEKEIGKISEKGETQEIVIEDAEQRFPKWYKIWNSTARGNDEMVFVLKNLKVTSLEAENGKSKAKIDFFGATFLKNGDEYHFISKKDTAMVFLAKNSVSDAALKIIPALTVSLIRKSFKIKQWEKIYNLEETINFDQKMLQENASLKNKDLKNGIYKDFESFQAQIPAVGNFTIEKDKRDEIIRVVDNTKKSKFFNVVSVYAVVENGVGYLRTLSGFYYTINKNEKGLYITGSKNGVLPQNNSPYQNYGLLPTAINILAKDAKDKKYSRNTIYDIIIDPYTGELDFPDQ